MLKTMSTNLKQLPPSGIAEALRRMRGTGISLYVHGAIGIAKSSVARQVADDAGIAFIDIRLAQRAPEDVRGAPTVGEIDHMKGLVWLPPLEMPRDLDYSGVTTVTGGTAIVKFFNPVGDNGIRYCTRPHIEAVCVQGYAVDVSHDLTSFTVTVREPETGTIVQPPVQIAWKVTGEAEAIMALDEFNSAEPSVMAAAYQLVLDRRLGDYVVPKRVMIVALGNRDIDRGITYEIKKPVANRFIHLEMVFNWQDWLAWAVTNSVHPDVIGYLSKWRDRVHIFDPDSAELSFPTPRSWEFASKVCHLDPAPPPELGRALIAGAIGDAVASEFLQHRQFMDSMPDINGVLDGTVTTFKADRQHEIQIAYSVCVQMCHELRSRADQIARTYQGRPEDFPRHPARREWLAQADNAFAYAVKHFRKDVTIMAARLAMDTYKLKLNSAHMPRFAAFVDENHDELMT